MDVEDLKDSSTPVNNEQSPALANVIPTISTNALYNIIQASPGAVNLPVNTPIILLPVPTATPNSAASGIAEQPMKHTECVVTSVAAISTSDSSSLPVVSTTSTKQSTDLRASLARPPPPPPDFPPPNDHAPYDHQQDYDYSKEWQDYYNSYYYHHDQDHYYSGSQQPDWASDRDYSSRHRSSVDYKYAEYGHEQPEYGPWQASNNRYERRRDRPSDRQTPLRKSSTSGHSRPRSDPSRYSSRPSEQKKPYRRPARNKDDVSPRKSRDSGENQSRRKRPATQIQEILREKELKLRKRMNEKRRLAGNRSDDLTFDEEDDRWRKRVELTNSLFEWLELESETSSAEPAEEHGASLPHWCRSSPADLYFSRTEPRNGVCCIEATKRMRDLENSFRTKVLANFRIEDDEESTRLPSRRRVTHTCSKQQHDDDSGASSSSDDDDDDGESFFQERMNALRAKQKHPHRMHNELWFNESGEVRARCSAKAKQFGLRHNIYPGEEPYPMCDPNSNNMERLYHYRVTISPDTNLSTKTPTVITYDNHVYQFEGFSLISHYYIPKIPTCKVIRFNIEYNIQLVEEKPPENFTISSIDLFAKYVMYDLLNLHDVTELLTKEDSCTLYHVLPRFSRKLPDNGKEVLSMNEVILYFLKAYKPLIQSEALPLIKRMSQDEWQLMVDQVRGMIVSQPGKKPGGVRVDQLDRAPTLQNAEFPVVVHFGTRPAILSYAGDKDYQVQWKAYAKFKHLLANKPRVTLEDKQKLQFKEEKLQQLRQSASMKREVTIELSSETSYKTGLFSDVCQHALLLPVLFTHVRFHKCLASLEAKLQYSFKDKMLLQLALTHASYRTNYGTNPDHVRNSLTNCGLRQPEYGDRKVHHSNTRKRGINTLINIMSRMGKRVEARSEIAHNERLEFLGDAVVEFLSSIHLYFLFPNIEEGGLATYRAALVQNQHLAVLARVINLQDYLLFAHGPDLCHDSELKHAMANCFEALMGALFLDGGLDLPGRIFAECIFANEEKLQNIWKTLPPHPLQEDEPKGDRHWIKTSPVLQKLTEFEKSTGIEFRHIRLLARVFTLRNMPLNNLTFGHNQRMEFLGDTVLQLIVSEYLFKHFPEHHEGHLSLLRSCLVNNKTQSVVCDDLGMTSYIMSNKSQMSSGEMKHKEKADILEALIGGMFVDRGLGVCRSFCDVCFFPRLKEFILNQEWNDPKSQLQQCCLTLRELEGGEPDIPHYKVIETIGPTNTRRYTVAVYFRNERLATGCGHSMQQAEMNAAFAALNERSYLFPQLKHQKSLMEKKYYKDATNKRGSGERKKRGEPRGTLERTGDGKNKAMREEEPEYVCVKDTVPAKETASQDNATQPKMAEISNGDHSPMEHSKNKDLEANSNDQSDEDEPPTPLFMQFRQDISQKKRAESTAEKTADTSKVLSNTAEILPSAPTVDEDHDRRSVSRGQLFDGRNDARTRDHSGSRDHCRQRDHSTASDCSRSSDHSQHRDVSSDNRSSRDHRNTTRYHSRPRDRSCHNDYKGWQRRHPDSTASYRQDGYSARSRDQSRPREQARVQARSQSRERSRSRGYPRDQHRGWNKNSAQKRLPSRDYQSAIANKDAIDQSSTSQQFSHGYVQQSGATTYDENNYSNPQENFESSYYSAEQHDYSHQDSLQYSSYPSHTYSNNYYQYDSMRNHSQSGSQGEPFDNRQQNQHWSYDQYKDNGGFPGGRNYEVDRDQQERGGSER